MNIRERFKLLRIVRILSNLKYLKSLKANKLLYKQFGIQRQVWLPLSHAHIPKREGEGPWLDEEVVNDDQITSHPAFPTFSHALQEQLLSWSKDGYLILPGFFKAELIDAVDESLTKALNDEEKHHYHTNRLLNIYKTNKSVDTLFRDDKLLAILSFLFGKEVLPFQTINFYRSSTQHTHSDAVHLTTAPLGYSAVGSPGTELEFAL